MIAYILTSPDGAQSLGFVTGPSQTVGGVACLSGYLEDLSEWTNRANISRAQGDLPEPVEFSFSLIDWTGLVRRSAGLLDGSAPLIGWRVDAYVSTDGATWNIVNLPGSGLVKFEIVEATAGGDSIQIQCRERWISNAQTVGFGVGTSRVGLVVGGKQLTVKVPEIAEPVPIEYSALSGWYKGNGFGGSGGYSAAPATRTEPTSIDSVGANVLFVCASPADAIALTDALFAAANPMISGQLCVESVASWTRIGSTVYIPVSQEFADIEEVRGCFLCDLGNNSIPIAYGAASLDGFVGNDGSQLSMIGMTANADYLQSFSPSQLAPGGFRAYSLIPISIAFQTLSPALVFEADAYYGSTESVITDLSSLPAYDTYDVDLKPSASSTWTMWARVDDANPMIAAMRVIPASTAGRFDRYMVDVSDRVVVNQNFSMSGAVTTRAEGRDSYHSGAPIDWTSDALLNSSNPTLRNSWTIERTLLGPTTYVSRRSFATVDDINLTIGLEVRSQSDLQVCVNWQLRAVNLYGISALQYGSSYAVVTPGASPWGTSLTPIQAVYSFASTPSGADWSFAAQTSNVIASQWSRFFDAETTTVEAAKAIAQEHWIVLGRGGSEQVIGYGRDILEAPTFTLGDRNDIATEIVIEYDEWAGEYRRKAYVSHVDEAYDPGNSARYFGGWSSDDNPEGYGMAIWNACRKAYQLHGILSSVSLQAPSVSSGDVLGRMWLSARNGVSRIRWLCLQSRYMSFRVVDQLPTWWAGNTVQVPIAAADLAGYDLSGVEGQYLVCTEKAWNPLTLTTRFELALPPVTSTGTQLRIQQTLDAPDRYIQTLDATDRIIQVQEV